MLYLGITISTELCRYAAIFLYFYSIFLSKMSNFADKFKR